MHEIGIMSSAMDSVLAQARANSASRVHRIVLRIGTLSGVDPDALRFAFDVVAQGTPAEGASLEIETVQARARCPDCDLEFGVASGFIFTCPKCERLCSELRQGRELELARIEIS